MKDGKTRSGKCGRVLTEKKSFCALDAKVMRALWHGQNLNSLVCSIAVVLGILAGVGIGFLFVWLLEKL